MRKRSRIAVAVWALLLIGTAVFTCGSAFATSEHNKISQVDNERIRQLASALLPAHDDDLKHKNAGLFLGRAGATLIEVVHYTNFAAELYKLLKTGKPIGPYQPVGWRAIPTALCKAAKLPVGRCVSLPCLRASNANKDTLAAPCELTPHQLAAAGNPPQPSKAAQWKYWLQKIDASSLPPDIADPLKKGNLPINDKIVAAKGVLHAIWPELLSSRRHYSKPNLVLKAANLPALLTSVLKAEGERATNAAQVVAVSSLTEKLPASAINLLDREAPGFAKDADRLKKSARKIKGYYSHQAGIARLPNKATAAIDEGTEALADMRRSVPEVVLHLPNLAVAKLTKIAADKLCPQVDDYVLFPLAGDGISLPGKEQPKGRIELALKETARGRSGVITAELVAAVSVNVRKVFDGKGNSQPNSDWKCKGTLRQIFPLGVTIHSLRERQGRLVLDTSRDTLIQRTTIERMRRGLTNLARRLGSPIQWPVGLKLESARLKFSRDFRSVELRGVTSVAALNYRHELAVPLVVDGKLQSNMNLVSILDLDGLVKFMNERLARNPHGWSLSIGQMDATIKNFSLVPPDMHPNDARWLSLLVALHAGDLDLGTARATLVEHAGKVRVEPAVDLTPLFRTALAKTLVVLANQGKSIGEAMRSYLQTTGKSAKPFVKAISRALLVHKVELTNDGSVLVTLGLDIGSMSGQQSRLVVATGPLNFRAADLGLPHIYDKLADAAVKNGRAWINLVAGRLKAAIGKLTDQAVDAAIQKLEQAAESAGIRLKFKPRPGSNEFDLTVTVQDTTLSIQRVLISSQPLAIDFRKAKLSEQDKKRLAKAVVGKVNSLIPLGWEQCQRDRISIGATGIVLELGLKNDLLGCVPLPSVVFNGRRLLLDSSATVNAITAVLRARVVSLLPKEIAQYAGDANLSDDKKHLLIHFNAKVPGTGGVSLTGIATINLTNGKIKVDINNKNTIFTNIFRYVAGNFGGPWNAEPLRDRIGLRASGKINFGSFGVAVNGMVVTPAGVDIPELAVRLPVAVVIPPVTIFPVEIDARIQSPNSVKLIGDASLAGATSIAMLRGQMSFDKIPPKEIRGQGTLIALNTLGLFRTTTTLHLGRPQIDGVSETVGLLKAVMPFRQKIHLDKHKATLSARAKILGINIDGAGKLVFNKNPTLALSGKVDAGSLAQFSGGITTDVFLTDPTATVSGSVGFLLGDIKFWAKANLHRARLSAEVIGIQASITVPSLASVNTDMAKALFAFLLKPSIDLKDLRNLNVQVSPRIAGGGGGKGNRGGDEGGGLDEGGQPISGPAEIDNGHHVVNPPASIPVGTTPSEWQSGWLRSPADGRFYCWAEWKSPKQIQWFDDERYPLKVANMMGRDAPPSLILGKTGDSYYVYRNCSDKLFAVHGASEILFFPAGKPVIWKEGTDHVTDAGWVEDVIRKVDGRMPTVRAPPSFAAASILTFMYDHGIDSANDVQEITLAGGNRYWIATRAPGEIEIVDPKRGTRVFDRSTPLGQWLAGIISSKPDLRLRKLLLPILFKGRGTPEVLAAEPTSGTPDAMLLGLLTSNGQQLIIPVSRKPFGGCSAGLPASGTLLRAAANSSSEFAVLLQDLRKRLHDCGYWNKLTVVGTPGAQPERLVLFHGDASNWAVAFTDRKMADHQCLRIGLDRERLQKALMQWQSAGTLSQTRYQELLTHSQAAIVTLLGDDEPDSSKLGFPFNPLILATCPGKQ